ncbi:MAG: hypothetical protein KBD00_02045 [Candidatus Peribacteraceae bacterium]|nr:hypothetical protein [Candidatus Peribacteraceae bacterium]
MTRYTDQQCANFIADKTGLLVEVALTELDTGVVELDVRYQSTLVIHQQPAPNLLRGINLPSFFHYGEETLPFRLRLVQLLGNLALRHEILKRFQGDVKEGIDVPESIIRLEDIRTQVRECTELVLDAFEATEIRRLLAFARKMN